MRFIGEKQQPNHTRRMVSIRRFQRQKFLISLKSIPHSTSELCENKLLRSIIQSFLLVMIKIILSSPFKM